MFRGGFPLGGKVNMNYAAYVSATSIGIESVDSERHAGGRMGFFFPGPRVEVGGSWQRTLQGNRKSAFGFHMGWQPTKLPLSLRSEYAHSFEGSGYWVEGGYRLSQVRFWQKAMRRTGSWDARNSSSWERSEPPPKMPGIFPAWIHAKPISASIIFCAMV